MLSKTFLYHYHGNKLILAITYMLYHIIYRLTEQKFIIIKFDINSHCQFIISSYDLFRTIMTITLGLDLIRCSYFIVY